MEASWGKLWPMLNRLDENLWEILDPLKFAGITSPLGHRMTILRLADGGLVLHSPVVLRPALVEELAGLGEVRAIVAPSLMHNLYLAPWLDAFPSIPLVCPPGFREKYDKLPYRQTLPTTDPGFPADELRALRIDGIPVLKESAYFHLPSRSVIVADLVMNVRDVPGFFGRLLAKMNGIYRRPACSRMLRMFIRDRPALRASLDRLQELDFDRLIVGHGAVVEGTGKQALGTAYDWLFDAP